MNGTTNKKSPKTNVNGPKASGPAGGRGLLLGEIRGDAVYPLEVFRQRTGLGVWALRAMRRSGLQVIRCSGRSFIRGADFFAFLDNQANTGETGGK